MAVDGRSRLPKRRTGHPLLPRSLSLSLSLSLSRAEARGCQSAKVRRTDRQVDGGGEELVGKRILTGTAVIWRALCGAIVARRASKRKARDDVRFPRCLHIMPGQNATSRSLSSPRGRVSRGPTEKFVCVCWYRRACHGRLCPQKKRRAGHCRIPIAVAFGTFARDKLSGAQARPIGRSPLWSPPNIWKLSCARRKLTL